MVDTDTRESEESVLSKQSLGMMHQSEGEKTEEDEGRIVNSSTNSSIPTCNIPMDGASDTSSSALPAIMQDANDRQAAFSTEMAAITNQSVDSGDDDTGDDSDSSNYVEIGFGGDYTASKVTFMTGGSSLPQSLPLPPSRAASTVSNISSSDIPTTSTNTAAPTGSNNLSYRRGSSNINNGMDAYQQQQQQQHWVVDWTEMMGAMDTAFQENVAIPTRSAVRKIFYTTTGNAGSASAAPPNVSATTSSLPVATAATTKKRGRCYNHLTNNGASIVSNSHVYNDDRRKNDNDTSNNKSPYVIATDHEEEYKQTNDNDHDQENEEDEEAIAMKKRHVEKFWKFYDDVISVSLGSLLGILARILAARFFTYVDMGTVFVDGSVLFTNLPLNCLSTFLLGLFGSGHDCLKIVYTRSNGLKRFFVSQSQSISHDCGHDLTNNQLRRMNADDEMREVQLAALERRIRNSPSLLLFPAKKQPVDLLEHAHNLNEQDRMTRPILDNGSSCDYDNYHDMEFGLGKISGNRRRRRRKRIERERMNNGDWSHGDYGSSDNTKKFSGLRNSTTSPSFVGGIMALSPQSMPSPSTSTIGSQGVGEYDENNSSYIEKAASWSHQRSDTNAVIGAVDGIRARRRRRRQRLRGRHVHAQHTILAQSPLSDGQHDETGRDVDDKAEDASVNASFRNHVGDISCISGGDEKPEQRIEGGSKILNVEDEVDSFSDSNCALQHGSIMHACRSRKLKMRDHIALPQSEEHDGATGEESCDGSHASYGKHLHKSFHADHDSKSSVGEQNESPTRSKRSAPHLSPERSIIDNTSVNLEPVEQTDIMDHVRYIIRLRIAEGWDVGTTAEAMKHDLLLGLRVGFCGALSTFSSWNSSMLTLLRDGKVVSAIVGYYIGLVLPIIAYRTGQYLAMYLFIWKCRRETSRAERRGGYGLRINGDESSVDSSDGPGTEEATRILDESASEREVPSVRAILTAIFLLALVFIFTSFHIFPSPSSQLFAISLLFTPFGALARWKLTKLNSIRSSFPVGTFACNIIGCALAGSLGSFLKGDPGPKASFILVGIVSGVGGSLSTLAGFLMEVLDGIDPIIFKYDGIIYACVTVFWAAIVGLVTSQSKDWADKLSRF